MACTVTLDDDLIVTVPVHVKKPQSVRPTAGRGAPKQTFVTATIYVDMRIPSEDELDEMDFRLEQHSADVARRLGEARARLDEALPEEQRVGIEAEIAAIRREFRSAQAEKLREVVIGLPDNHGIGNADGTPAEWEPGLVDRLCRVRHIRTALWDAFVLALNGEGKRGN